MCGMVVEEIYNYQLVTWLKAVQFSGLLALFWQLQIINGY